MKNMLKLMYVIAVFLLSMSLIGCGGDDDKDENGATNNTTNGNVEVKCGNDVKEDSNNEECDGEDFGGATCQSNNFDSGNLKCTAECKLDTSECEEAEELCGNGELDDGEDCDGDKLAGNTCEDESYDGGTLKCDDECKYDVSECTGAVVNNDANGSTGVCGDGFRDEGEECDQSDINDKKCEDMEGGFVGGELNCTTECKFDTSACMEAATIFLGQACLKDEECCADGVECPAGSCFTEINSSDDYNYGPAGGHCMETCDDNGLCSKSGGVGTCVEFSNGFTTCLVTCDPNSTDTTTAQCRAGYECSPLGSSEVGICIWGACDDDAQCTATGNCETGEESEDNGWCITPDEICDDGLDNDFDEKVDCSDSACTGEPACPKGEICGNNIDDDADTAVDCDDAECGQFGICTGELCTPPESAAITCGTSLTGESNDAEGSTNVINSAHCLDSDGSGAAAFQNEVGPEYAYKLTVTDSPKKVDLTIGNFTGDLDIYVIKETLGEYCDAHRGCFEFGGNGADTDEELRFTAYPGVTYYVVVDGFSGDVSTYDVLVECEDEKYEDCGNTTDDDEDELVDCEDPDCFGIDACNTESDCGNGQDDDLDGLVDCLDADDCTGTDDCKPGKGYWEWWNRTGDAEFDLEGKTLSFTVDAENTQGFSYAVTEDVTTFPVEAGTSDTTEDLVVEDDKNVEKTLPFTFTFQGEEFTTIYIMDNGYISFEKEEGVYPGPNAWNIYIKPRIGALWTDIYPPDGGKIVYDVFTDKVAITWDGVKNYGSADDTENVNKFQLVLNSNGNVDMTWLDVAPLSTLPSNVSGYVTLIGAVIGLPPAVTDFFTITPDENPDETPNE